MGAELPFAEPGAELAHACGELARLAPRKIAPEHADDRGALEESEVERQLRNFAGGEADDEQPPAPGERTERGLGVGSADRVVDHVDAAAVGERLDALAQVLLRIVDSGVGAVAPAHGELLFARRAGDDARPERLAD